MCLDECAAAGRITALPRLDEALRHDEPELRAGEQPCPADLAHRPHLRAAQVGEELPRGRGRLRPGVGVAAAHARIREVVPHRDADASPAPEIAAVRDLLHLDVDVSTYLPPDTISHGFDNVASTLSVVSGSCRTPAASRRSSQPPTAPTQMRV